MGLRPLADEPSPQRASRDDSEAEADEDNVPDMGDMIGMFLGGKDPAQMMKDVDWQNGQMKDFHTLRWPLADWKLGAILANVRALAKAQGLEVAEPPMSEALKNEIAARKAAKASREAKGGKP